MWVSSGHRGLCETSQEEQPAQAPAVSFLFFLHLRAQPFPPLLSDIHTSFYSPIWNNMGLWTSLCARRTQPLQLGSPSCQRYTIFRPGLDWKERLTIRLYDWHYKNNAFFCNPVLGTHAYKARRLAWTNNWHYVLCKQKWLFLITFYKI